MPIYEYTCQKCNAHIELIQKVSDKPLTRHGECGGKLVKEWSQTSFQLKGSGWYVTDYAGKKAETKEPKDSKDSKEPKDSKESKESKGAGGDSPDKSATAGDKSKEKTPKAAAPKSSTGGTTGD